MSIEEIIGFVRGLGGVLVLEPGPDDGSPEIAWGDAFFYYAPDGAVPTTTQPFATIVTKDYPGDEGSRLDRPGAFRLNIAAGKDAFARWTAQGPGDPAAADVLRAHPVYADAGWLAVVNPGPASGAAVRELLRTAHGRARRRYERRSALRRP
ncbi:hypothetical protein GCM10009527_037720 [Actinomadura nitritigenes]|uniref:DUF6194 domain-containing protein n=1 Tax=Actinomadura nitritigenes TaxID=134602 RepID=A0ABS3QR75_9ACTN|nr:DUF6194 family protein [Actinomadura nitritigenes]MBO2436489.1 hypothetical protein [Actinomadura nitritigenes]